MNSLYSETNRISRLSKPHGENRRFPQWFASIGFALLLSLVPKGQAQSLDDLLRLQDYTAHRASSADPSGGNMDMRRVNAGQSLTLAELQGPGVVAHVWFTYLYPSRNALRKLVLRIYFDDIAEPCVEAPLGDFFGLGNSQTYAYASQPLAVGAYSGLNCYWPMPFSSRAKLVVSNEGAQDCNALYFQIDYRTLKKPMPDRLHFFAAYRQAYPPGKGEPYEILKTDGGQGHFAGCNLSIEQMDASWWGEGDVRMFVDGEAKPSIAGTGSEDDFSGAWCYSHEFAYPYFGAPMRARFNKQGVLEHCTSDLKGKELTQWQWPEAWQPGDLWNVYRYHIPDPVSFQKSIRVNIEHGSIMLASENNLRSDWYSSVAYWYQTGKPSSRVALPSVKDRTPNYLHPHDHGGGRWEGEDFADDCKASGGTVQEAGMGFWGDTFSGQYALEWNANKTNDTLLLPFTIEKAGRYKITVRLAHNENGGRFQAGVDENVGTELVNTYTPESFPAPFDVIVADADFQSGEHILKFMALSPETRSKGKRLMLDKFHVEKTK